NENDGEVAPRLTQRLLHIQTTRAGESDIEDETCRTINRGVVEKCLGRPKGLGGESHRANESRQGTADRLIVIHHVHDRVVHRSASLSVVTRARGCETDGEGAECPDRRRHWRCPLSSRKCLRIEPSS